MNKYLPLLFPIFLVLACSSDDSDDMSIDPQNLVVDIEILDDSPGSVRFKASGDHVYIFELNPGDFKDTVLQDTEGNFEYRYVESGIFEAEIRAYGTSGRFISQTQRLSIDLNDPIDTTDGYSTPLSYSGMQLVWQDEFSATSLNEGNWTYEIGDGCPDLCGWGNNELQYYTDRNVRLENGLLILEARSERLGGRDYTSSRIITKDKASIRYGRVDIRAKLPEGQGIWPAFWMLGQSFDDVGWPACGEIDIMEMKGGQGRENTVHGTAHWDLDGRVQAGDTLMISEGLNESFHVYSIIWNDQEIEWFLDDQSYFKLDITEDHQTEFHRPFFFIINIAVGGTFSGNPDATTRFPTSMYVDYIRAFQEI
jgi:beta-glucanase (GH16 family)